MFLRVPQGLTASRAEQIRATVMKAPTRIDYVHRHLAQQMIPGWRACTQKFRDDGILCPFGGSRADFTVPNPTFFQNADSWPMHDNADPMGGWPVSEIFATRTTARNDVNAKLFHHVRGHLVSFQERLHSLSTDFRLYNGDVREVVPMLGEKYDRIEVLNISQTCSKH